MWSGIQHAQQPSTVNIQQAQHEGQLAGKKKKKTRGQAASKGEAVELTAAEITKGVDGKKTAAEEIIKSVDGKKTAAEEIIKGVDGKKKMAAEEIMKGVDGKKKTAAEEIQSSKAGQVLATSGPAKKKAVDGSIDAYTTPKKMKPGPSSGLAPASFLDALSNFWPADDDSDVQVEFASLLEHETTKQSNKFLV